MIYLQITFVTCFQFSLTNRAKQLKPVEKTFFCALSKICFRYFFSSKMFNGISAEFHSLRSGFEQGKRKNIQLSFDTKIIALFGDTKFFDRKLLNVDLLKTISQKPENENSLKKIQDLTPDALILAEPD